MRRIIALILALGTLIGLCGCQKQNTGANESDCSLLQVVADSEGYGAYQSYTLGQNNLIIDSATGELVSNDKLTIDSNGNIVLKENGQVVVSYEQVQKNKEKLNVLQQKNESSQATVQGQNTKISSQDQTSSNSSSNGASTSPVTHVEPTPLPEAANWDALYGGNEWSFFSTKADRQINVGDAISYRISFQQDGAAIIYEEGYDLPENLSRPQNADDIVKTFNGVTYIKNGTTVNYRGNYSSTVGSEDIVTIELRCYDASGKNWLSDELIFMRKDNNTLKLVNNEYDGFDLKSGDVFLR